MEPTEERGHQDITPPAYVPGTAGQPQPKILSTPLNSAALKDFFRVTGGSSLYCLSAVFIAYGIVTVLKPILAGSDTLREALPCLLTLHVYELALLGVLLLIVFKKVVDDAISLAMLLALFLVGSSIALGSVADRALTASLYLGLAGTALALVKIGCMRRFARIPFKTLSVLGLLTIMAYNYLGPVLMARSVSVNAADESLRRSIWLGLYLLVLLGAGAVWIEAMRGNPHKHTSADKPPFLQSPVMVYLFAAVVAGACGVHQYTMAYAFTLERVMLDYVPIAAVVCLLVIEILRYAGKRDALIEAVIVCIPLGLVLLAIYNKSVLSSGRLGIGLLAYPPVMLAMIGMAAGVLAVRRRNRWLWISVFAYGLGVALTAGYSPEYPHAVNLAACAAILVTALLVYGLVRGNPYVCVAGVFLLSVGLPFVDRFAAFVKAQQVTEIGGFAGLCGAGLLGVYLIFTQKLGRLAPVAGALLLAAFLLDFLPGSLQWRYLFAAAVVGGLMAAVWLQTRDWIVIAILSGPFFIKAYVLGRQLAAWRYVIVGFLLLGAGAVVSLFKRSAEPVECESEKKPSGPPEFGEP
jgi:F0F1-type ATP synthase assembly protein I